VPRYAAYVRVCVKQKERERERERERENTTVRSGSPSRKNGAASGRRVQNSAGIPRVSSPMGNNEDSASFITTCSSISDPTTRARPRAVSPPNGLGLLPLSPGRATETRSTPGASLSLPRHLAATRVRHPHPLQPLIFSRFRPTPADYPGNALSLVIAGRGTGLDIVRKVTV